MKKIFLVALAVIVLAGAATVMAAGPVINVPTKSLMQAASAIIKPPVKQVAGSKIISQAETAKREQLQKIALTFINNVLLSNGQTASIVSIEPISGLYLVKVKLGSDTIDSYITADGKTFFPQAMDIAQATKAAQTAPQSNSASQPAAAANLPQTDKPKVELFVMSYCPYGTQMEKGILPVVKTLGDKIDFQLKYVSYSMHGKQEVDENTNQYCINQLYPNQFNDYLTCFLQQAKSADCVKAQNFDQTKLTACVSATDQQYKITESFNASGNGYPAFNIYKDDNVKYNVQGSPTLIINGSEANTARDSASLLTTICSAFKTKPAECSVQLSSATPAPGFGSDTTAAGGASSCN